ncbi:macro domain-containing protein [Geomonas agri]|uniref:macro domain-containing protein n=1 Tax=Geomonas agri TaxID=2873702 RepID=UPI001CD5A74B|nr:macro domain-containing protein [Geomonas agri]
MALKIIQGNIFTSHCQTIVNTVNCSGIMGAGIALECRFRWPQMFQAYVGLCQKKQMKIGLLWLYRASDRWILNFPTKNHWKDPSKEEYLHLGLQKFMGTYEQKGIESVAFPLLGAQNGGLDQDISRQIMESYLRECIIPVEIYRYDPNAPDDLFLGVKDALAGRTAAEIREAVGLHTDQAEKVLDALQNPAICQLNRVATVSGIGLKTVEKLFSFARNPALKVPDAVQQPLTF